jgi:hypothetical protein
MQLEPWSQSSRSKHSVESRKGVRFYRLQPDDVLVELVAPWKKDTPSVTLRAFLDLIDAKASLIRKKAEPTR